MPEQPIFRWKGTATHRDDVRSAEFVEGAFKPKYTLDPQACGFCGTSLEAELIQKFCGQGKTGIIDHSCPFCGYICHCVCTFPADINVVTYDMATLVDCDINASELGLGELTQYLAHHRTDVFDLTPRRFELLVATIFQNLGFETRVTKQSRDGGYDLVLVEASNGKQVIVECKRYAANGSVGVGFVRSLLGVQLLNDVDRGVLVTTSSFSQPAAEAALKAKQTSSRISIELLQTDELLDALSVLNVTRSEFADRLKDRVLGLSRGQ
jgi:hypothetical protein